MMDAQALEARLRAEQLWRHAPSDVDEGPWYVRVLVGGAAWLGACLLLPLIGLVWLEALRDVPAAMIVSGLAACLAGVALQRLRGEFVRQAGSAVALAGVIVVAVELESYGFAGWLATAALALMLYLAGRGYTHRFLCAGVMAVALVFALTEPWERGPSQTIACASLALAAAVLWWLARPLGLRRGPQLAPMALAYTCVVSILVWWVPGASLLADGGAAELGGTGWFWLGVLAGLPVAVTAALASQVDAAHRAAHSLVPGGMLLLAPAWLAAPGVGLAACWLALGHAHGRPVLAGVGVAAMLTYLARFYYVMETTLLHKAFWLGAAGTVLLALAWLLTQRRGGAA